MADDKTPLNHPWLVAVWPGMGHVGIEAGYYLMVKLQMELFAEVNAQDLFDVDFVNVKDGILASSPLPRNRFFIRRDPDMQRDLIVFIGEAQPPLGKNEFCRHVVELAKEWKVERVFTFAAMATDVGLNERARVYCAASSPGVLESLKPHGLVLLREGRISGLNGVLLAAAAQAGIDSVCLLGEMPHYFVQIPYPKASLIVLKIFERIMQIKVDLSELEEHAKIVNDKLNELIRQIEKEEPGEESSMLPASTEAEELSVDDHDKIEQMFAAAALDRAKAYELKRELDRLGVFTQYENRFLDLFKGKE